MGNPLLDSLAVHHPRACRDLKKERPDQVNLPVDKNNVREIPAAQKQATGANQKNSEQNAHYLLTIFLNRGCPKWLLKALEELFGHPLF